MDVRPARFAFDARPARLALDAGRALFAVDTERAFFAVAGRRVAPAPFGLRADFGVDVLVDNFVTGPRAGFVTGPRGPRTSTACAADSRAMGTRNGEQLT